MKIITLTMAILLVLSLTTVFAQSLPEYEVYVFMVSKYINGGGIFRFADDSDPVLYSKNYEDAPINCIYVKGPGIELIYGPGPSEETIRTMGILEDEVPKCADFETLLGKIGVTVEQINYVVVGHTCFDELGGVDQFPNAKVIVQKAAFDNPNPLGFAFPDDMAKLDELKAQGRLTIIEGDHELAPGLNIYHVPGHTFESQLLTANTRDGKVVMTGDACYTYLNLQRNALPVDWCISDDKLMLQSYEKIRALIGKSDALMVPAHDMDVYRRFISVAEDVVKVEYPKLETTPKYQVYSLMVSMFKDGGALFRFADDSNPVLYAKNREDAPINCIYVKGENFDLIYGPGPSKSAMETIYGGQDPFYVDHETLLSRINVKLEDIDYVVLDHTCFDHPGGMDLFPNAKVIVQKNLFEKPNPLGLPMPDGTTFNLALEEDYAKIEKIMEEGRLMVIDGDYQIAPGIKNYYAPGHTYETNFLSVNSKDGNIVITGDSCYTYLNLKKNMIPMDFVVTDADLTIQSYEKIRQVVGPNDSLLVPGHDMDVYKRYTKVADRVVKVELPITDYSNVFFMSLDKGLNMISLPLQPWVELTADDFAKMLGATMVIKLDEKIGKFVGFVPGVPVGNFKIEGGKGYIVNVEKAKTVAFVGAPWTNTPPYTTAPGLNDSSTWAYVVSGRLDVADGNYTIQARNIRTGIVMSDKVTNGYFILAWADLMRHSVIQIGDELEITAMDANGNVVSRAIHRIDYDNIIKAHLSIPLKLGKILPYKTQLLQNYPNPFNPETWIPYQLSKDDSVFIRIYDIQGRLVRSLDIGIKPADTYATKDKAAYWDGRDSNGEVVGSGIYFYELKTNNFSEIKKMIIQR